MCTVHAPNHQNTSFSSMSNWTPPIGYYTHKLNRNVYDWLLQGSAHTGARTNTYHLISSFVRFAAIMGATSVIYHCTLGNIKVFWKLYRRKKHGKLKRALATEILDIRATYVSLNIHINSVTTILKYHTLIHRPYSWSISELSHSNLQSSFLPHHQLILS